MRMIQTKGPYICNDEDRDLFFKHDRIFNNEGKTEINSSFQGHNSPLK